MNIEELAVALMPDDEAVAHMMKQTIKNIDGHRERLEGRERLIWDAAIGSGMILACTEMTKYMLDNGLDETTYIGNAMTGVMETLASRVDQQPKPREVFK